MIASLKLISHVLIDVVLKIVEFLRPLIQPERFAAALIHANTDVPEAVLSKCSVHTRGVTEEILHPVTS